MISKLSHIRMPPFNKMCKTCQSKINGLSWGPTGKVTHRGRKSTNFQKQRLSILTRILSVLYLGFLYQFSDHKHIEIPLEVPWLFLVIMSVKVKSENESHSVVSDSLRPQRLYSPWHSPGQNTEVGTLFLLQGIFPTQGSNPGLPHCRHILYQLSHKRSPMSARETNIFFVCVCLFLNNIATCSFLSSICFYQSQL